MTEDHRELPQQALDILAQSRATHTAQIQNANIGAATANRDDLNS